MPYTKGMKITTYIDERLLGQAMKALKARSQREVLEAGLRNLLSDLQRKAFIKDFDRFQLRWTPQKLTRSRA
jgi:hypothetical protein